ncbi:pimeloyl-ACP methyl ester carboxylesterase [Sphingomonas naasensis]|uniref:Epoxide hydrolase n=1 Tax=Sphingomonas naasensis TaxID=1344951 RepID=A0A4S1W4N5_9SPHN|nr:epoxide hydrolase family protein [Sphingomonas naasensis]NIJ20699.1 pimeloyl-ACP methyl ester carboxylesterase [Sphingomonas naasensis]TGX37579.1 epoxide hydrolase [Sphingomonas naasensis]
MPGWYPSVGRRHFLVSSVAGTVGALVPLSANASTPPPPVNPAETLVQAAAATSPATATIIGGLPSDAALATPFDGDDRIRPFSYHASNAALADLRHRIAAVRWPSKELVSDPSQGVQLATMRKLADYWERHYDWHGVEARMNALPQFVTRIDGIDIHFIHVRSQHPNALPLIVTHGWPGSIIEQLKIIGPLTHPTAYGGTAADAFDVVIPSIPGHGFSGKPTELGWDPVRVAKAWAVLMDRLGYKRFVASGGDWGDPITEQLAVHEPGRVLGVHLNMPSAIPPEIEAALAAGGAPPAGLSAEEQQAYEQLDFFYKNGLGYAQEMNHRPQTLYALEDSPIGLAAWILDHDLRSYELIARVFDGKAEGLTRDDVLDNITLYWLTETAISSARLYWENKLAFFRPQGVTVPVVVSAFPDELYQAPRSWAERSFPRLVYYNRHPKGGHFAAWEQPEAFTHDLRAGFRSLH